VSASVIVVACRRHRWLAPCLASVLDQADEVVLVDNGSPERWVSAEGRRLGARVAELDRNVGFPAGVNAGLRLARGDVVALLNDDAMAAEGWVESASKALCDETIGAVAPKLLLARPYAEVRFDDEPWFAAGDPRPLGRAIRQAEVAGEDVLAHLVGAGIHALETIEADSELGRWRWSAGRTPFYVPLPEAASVDDVRINGEPVEGSRVVNLINNAGSYLSAEGHGGDYGFETPDGPAFDEPADRFAACGAALAARTETFRRLGPLAGSFFAYYEDTDWCWRARLAGLRIRYEPTGVVRHVRGVSTGGASDRRVQFLGARNRLHCLARNAPLAILRWQLRRSLERDQPAGLGRALASRIPRGLAERQLLARRWVLSPSEVFRRWAGVDESWP
jgi:GT2 family glycosyltransferase